jgi:hypothetical protein
MIIATMKYSGCSTRWRKRLTRSAHHKLFHLPSEAVSPVRRTVSLLPLSSISSLPSPQHSRPVKEGFCLSQRPRSTQRVTNIMILSSAGENAAQLNQPTLRVATRALPFSAQLCALEGAYATGRETAFRSYLLAYGRPLRAP